MAMRPCVWGGMVIVAVVALVGLSGVRTARRENRVATVFVQPWTHDGGTFVMRSEGRGPAATSRKARPPRGADADGVLFEWDIAGEYCFTDKEAWESAIETARSQVTHDLRLAVPPPRETVREKLVKDWEPEKNSKLLEGTE